MMLQISADFGYRIHYFVFSNFIRCANTQKERKKMCDIQIRVEYLNMLYAHGLIVTQCKLVAHCSDDDARYMRTALYLLSVCFSAFAQLYPHTHSTHVAHILCTHISDFISKNPFDAVDSHRKRVRLNLTLKRKKKQTRRN